MTEADSAEFEGSVALVTGAAGGMGRAHARALAARGALVVVQDIDGDGARETAALIGREGGRAGAAHAFDIADTARVRAMVEAVERDHGRLDIVINNAGIGAAGGIEDIDPAIFERMFGVHVRGHFFLVRAAVPGMKRRRAGCIVNVSSRWAQVGHDEASHYCAAKAALLGLTKAWAKELAPWNIRVNAIAPGGVWSAMALAERGGADGIREVERTVPLGRWAQPEEIAAVVCHLASPRRAGFITGQVIAPNGGASIVGF